MELMQDGMAQERNESKQQDDSQCLLAFLDIYSRASVQMLSPVSRKSDFLPRKSPESRSTRTWAAARE